MKIWRYIVFLFALFNGCQQTPYSKWRMNNASDDELSDQEKINLFITGTNKMSSSGFAAVARLYENQEKWGKALSAIKMAIGEDPMNSSYHSLMADYTYELGQKSVAYREALTAYQLGSKSLQQSLDLAKMAVALSEFSIVNNIIDSLLLAYPEDVDVLYMAARKHDKENNVGLAREYYERVKSAHPENRDNLFYFGRFLFTQRDLVTAKEVLHEAIEADSSKLICLLQGDVYFGLEQYDSAAFYYRMGSADGLDTATYNRALRAYSMAGNSDSLISLGRSAVQDYPEERNYLLITARTLDLRYKYEEALPYYLTLYQMDTLDTLVAEELFYLQRKIAYLQRKEEEQRKLTDSLSSLLPEETF